MTDRKTANRRRAASATPVLAVAVALFTLLIAVSAGASPTAVHLTLLLRETVQAEPEESDIVDSTSALALAGQETTLRVGNQVVYVTADPLDEHRIDLQYTLFATGPIPDQRSDHSIIDAGTPVIVDDIKGKGKSSYRLIITPTLSDSIPSGVTLPVEDGVWSVTPSAFYMFRMSPHALAQFHFLELRNALEYEYESVKDSLDLDVPGKVDFYFVDGPSVDVPLDARFDYQVDPSRNRVVARHDPQYTGVDVSATLLVKEYRWWGYAPELLAVGLSGFTTFADYFVLKDRREGQRIPLSKLARSIDFKRQPYPESFHHAASFVQWLIHRHGASAFRELYRKATDLALDRAMFSVYKKTLAELEEEWLQYLRNREFTAAEYFDFSKRSAAYHLYHEHYDLLKLALAGLDDPPATMYRALALAASQLGQWDSAVDYAYQMAERTPTDPAALSLLAEVQWADGDVDGAQYHLLRIIELAPEDARPYIVLGDIQLEQKRVDSARVLWEAGLAKTNDEDPAALELLLRLGRWQRAHRNPDSAMVLNRQAVVIAHNLMPKVPAGARPLTRMGEALMEADSLSQAQAYLETAAFVADAPQDLGRALINLGRCHDLEGRRESALSAYEAVFQIPATHYHRQLAHHYVNAIYSH